MINRLTIALLLCAPVAASTYTAGCAPSTTVGQSIICNFSLTSPAFFSGSDTVTLTPSDGSITITPVWSANIFYPSIGQTLYDFSFSASTTGVKTITFSNGQGWTDPAPVSVTVTGSIAPPPFPASLTPGFVQAVPFSSDGVSTGFTIPISPAAGNTVILGVDLYNADGPPYAGPSVVDNFGHALIQDGMIRYHYTSIYELEAIYRLKAGAGVTGITVTRSNSSYSLAVAAEFTNVGVVDTVDSAGNDIHSGCCWITGPLVTTNDKDLIIGWAAQADDGAHPPGATVSPWSLAASVQDLCCQGGGVESGTMVYQVTNAPGLYTPTGEGHYALAIGVAYKAAPVIPTVITGAASYAGAFSMN